MKPQDDPMDEVNADAATNSDRSGDSPMKVKSGEKDDLPIIEDEVVEDGMEQTEEAAA